MSASTPKPITTALIGLGYAGKVFHSSLLLSLPHLFTIRYIVEKFLPDELLQGNTFSNKFGAQAQLISDYTEALVDPDVDLVIIATPNDTHFRIAKAALEAGKHVLLDKPVTTTHAEAKALGQIAQQKQLVLYAFQNRRWDSDYLTVRKLLREGTLGPIIDFVSHYDRYRNYLKGTWKEQPVPGAGQFYSLGPHLIDQALHCFGRPTKVTAFIQNVRGMGDLAVDDDFTVILHFARTDENPYILTATLRGHLLSVRKPQLRFIVRGSKGTYSKYGIDVQEEQMQSQGAKSFSSDDAGREPAGLWGELELAEENGDISSNRLESEKGLYQDLYKNLFAAVRENAPLAIDWKEAELTMLITELAIRSAKEGRTIDVSKEESTTANDAPTTAESTEVSESGSSSASISITSVSTTPSHTVPTRRSSKQAIRRSESRARGWNWLAGKFKRCDGALRPVSNST